MDINPKPFRAFSFFGPLALVSLVFAPGFSRALELKDAVVICAPELERSEKKAVQMLEEEVDKRSQIHWQDVTQWPTNAVVVAIGPASKLERFAGPFSGQLQFPGANAPEGYRLIVRKTHDQAAVFVVGNDSRGVLFGAGRLLRELHMVRGSVRIDDNTEISTAPQYRLRGHQLGYRPKCNSYDAWDLPVWEQYFRDLAVFGCNSIELIPPRSDDAADSPHFPKPPLEMMVGMSSVADEYGLDVWVWYPAMDPDYSNPATVAFALKEWGEIFRKLPRLDAVFVPGGDPGHTRPKHLLALLEKQTENLHQFHPKAQMWVSPQSFNKEWFDEFVALLNQEHPAWLSGIVFGPQVRVSLPRLRELVPRQYPIRHYPDITHSRQCQYPVPHWDVAYAVTEARECINPRPEDETAIFRKLQPYTSGFITYSEGCNDDVNKCIWSALGWDPQIPVRDVLRQFSRYFIGEKIGNDFAIGLSALEGNWRGSLLTNQSVEATLKHFQQLERVASPFVLRNWRFQQALFRAYCDVYVRRRLLLETDLEQQAMEALRQASTHGSSNAIISAEGILERAVKGQAAPDLRARIFELGEALFQSIGMQLSVQKYKAIGIDRGATLDTLDYPVNNRRWLEERFAAIEKLPDEAGRLREIQHILGWTDAGSGGFYDDLGNPSRQPHLVREFDFEQDPGSMESPRSDFEEDLVADEPDEKTEGARRVSWMDHAETLYETALQVRYSGLDPAAPYKVRVVYAGDNPKRTIRLLANDATELHPYISKPVPFRPLEFSVPQSQTHDGNLILKWFGEPGLGGNGRGCQVSEVWLLKGSDSASP